MTRAGEEADGARSKPLYLLTEMELGRTGFRLTFSAPLEERYRSDTAIERARELRAITRLAAVLYFGCGLLLTLVAVRHPSWRDVILQLTGGTALIVLAQRFFRPNTADALREAALFGCCLVCALAAILIVYLRPGPASVEDFVFAALPANFVLMFVRIRIRAAVVFAACVFTAYLAAVLGRGDLDGRDQGFLIMVMAILCLPALVGVHAYERVSRRNYLFGLLERLRNEHLTEEISVLADLSYTDPLTGVANRRRLDEALAGFCARAQAGGALLLIDVDHFKSFNDRHGHLEGDACLRQIARRLQGSLRASDLVARFGGEEFSILLAQAGPDEAAEKAEFLRQMVERQGFSVAGEEVFVTVSIGIAWREAGCTPGALIRAADAALYAAKRAGRNRVRAAAS